MPPGATDGSTTHGQRCGKYKLRGRFEVPRGWKAVFFCSVQLPAALLWVANAVVNVVAIRVFWRSDSIFLCVAFGVGAALNFLFAAGQALYRIVVDPEAVEAWLGFHPKYLLIPPLTILFPLFFPAWLWLYPYPTTDPIPYFTVEEEEEHVEVEATMESPGSRTEVYADNSDMMSPNVTEFRNANDDSQDGASEDNSDHPAFSRIRSAARDESGFSVEHGQDTVSSQPFGSFTDHREPPGGPLQTRYGETTTLPPGIVGYRAVAEIEAASRGSASWHLLWVQYRSKVQRVAWAFDGMLIAWHVLVFASGALRAMTDPAFNDATYYVCVTGVLVKATYMILVFTAESCSRCLSRAYGVLGAASFAHDIFSSAFSIFICASFGLSIFNSLTPAPGEEPKDLHSLGLNGLAAFKAVQAFVWIIVGEALIGVVLGTIQHGFLLAARLKWSSSMGQKVCHVITVVFFVVVVLPHDQLLRGLVPSILYPLDAPPQEEDVDWGAFLRLFHFVTAHSDPAVRVKRLYFLLREELCDRIDDSRFVRCIGDYYDDDNDDDDDDEEPPAFIESAEQEASTVHSRIPKSITRLYKVLSTRPFSTRTLEESYREEAQKEQNALQQFKSVVTRLNAVGGLIQFVFPFLFVPSAGASWLMMTLFVGKCVSLVVILLSTPAAISYLHFWRELCPKSPLAFSIDCSSDAVLDRDDTTLVAFRRIARYFRAVDVSILVAAPGNRIPADISGRISGFLHPSQLVIPPEVDGNQFEEEYAADVFELPLWDGRSPRQQRRGWTME